MTLEKGQTIEYSGKEVGIVKTFGGKWVLEWRQHPIRRKSTKEMTVYGIEKGLIQKLIDKKVELLEIEDRLIPVWDIEEYEQLRPNDPFFKEPQEEVQYLIKIEK